MLQFIYQKYKNKVTWNDDDDDYYLLKYIYSFAVHKLVLNANI